jgi:hypothetical protein
MDADHCQHWLQPATVSQQINTTRHVTMEQQNPSSPQCVQGCAAGADMDAVLLRYVRPFSNRPITQLTRLFLPLAMSGNESASSRTREAFMQEEEPNRHRPQIQPLHVPITIGSTVSHMCVMW